jgi:hypothetical protein
VHADAGADGHTAVSKFKDIVIQDGSSFALKKKLRNVFPGRFTTTEPAAVEVHATYSGFSDEVCSVQIAPDKEADDNSYPIRDGMALLLANARHSDPRRDHKKGRLQTRLLVVGERP